MRLFYTLILALPVLLALAPLAAADPPTADAGNDRTIECVDADDTEVTLNGSGSSGPDDPAGDELEYLWESSSLNDPVEGVRPRVSMSL